MRIKYYRLTLRQMKLKKAFVFFLFIMFFCYLVIYFFNEKIEPTLKAVCQSNAKGVAFRASNEATLEYIENLEYEDLITLEKNSSNKVTAITANVSVINKLVNGIAYSIQENLDNIHDSKVMLPLSELCGIRVVGAKGPKLKVYTILEGNVEVKFKSTFEDAGINQTRHSLYVEISTNIKTLAPLFEDENTYVNDILIAETVIVSDIPSSYYEVNGVEGLDKKSILNVTEN